MSKHLPSLNAIRVFEVAARHLSLVRAAEELHVTHGAVSRQIKQLEENLGLELFERRNRAIFLTRAGLSLQGTCTDIMRQLEAGLRQLRQADDQPLVVSCEPTIAMRWLIPRLGKFRELHPELEIQIKLPPAKPEVYCWGASKALVTLEPPKGGYSPNFIWS